MYTYSIYFMHAAVCTDHAASHFLNALPSPVRIETRTTFHRIQRSSHSTMPDRERSRSPRRDRAPRGGSRDRDRERDRDRDRDRRDRDRDRDHDRTNDRRDRDAPRRDGDREDRPRPKKKTGGFNFKEKRRDDNDGDRDGDRRGGGGSLQRGYRHRSPSPRSKRPQARDAPDTSKPPVRAPAAAGGAKPGLEMIIVHVNDRLGTKAAIPCLPSDTIRQFKIIVAAKISCGIQ